MPSPIKLSFLNAKRDNKILLNCIVYIKYHEIYLGISNGVKFISSSKICQLKRASHWHWLVGHEEHINQSNTCNPDLNQLRETCRSGLDDTCRSVTHASLWPTLFMNTWNTNYNTETSCMLSLSTPHASWKFYKLVKHGFLFTSDQLYECVMWRKLNKFREV